MNTDKEIKGFICVHPWLELDFHGAHGTPRSVGGPLADRYNLY
jgi:hypothetical protein